MLSLGFSLGLGCLSMYTRERIVGVQGDAHPRLLAQILYHDEDYVLPIECFFGFDQNWDTQLVDKLPHTLPYNIHSEKETGLILLGGKIGMESRFYTHVTKAKTIS